jgi:hypothetical protein
MVNFNKKFAQSATELAIFGAILIFIIGGIVRIGLNTSLSLNSHLRVLRFALQESYLTSEGIYSKDNDAAEEGANARNTATVQLVEDRLSITPGAKWGTRDRMPFVSQATATMSKNLFRPVEYGDKNDLPMMDIIINGQRFPLDVTCFKEVRL